MGGPDTPAVAGTPHGVFAWRRRPRWSPTCPICSPEVAHDRAASATATAEPLAERRAGRAPPGCSAGSTARGCSATPTCTSRTGCGRLCGEADEPVLLATALAVRAVRQGSVCLLAHRGRRTTAVDGLTAGDVAALPWPKPARGRRRSGQPAGRRPVRGRRATGRCGWSTGWSTSTATGGRSTPSRGTSTRRRPRRRRVDPRPARAPRSAPDLPGRRPPTDSGWQRVVAAHRRFSIVAGGPGTGKTTTVARLLALLQDLADGALRVALAAPTGKAAARLTEAVAAPPAGLPAAGCRRLGTSPPRTLHRLLGSRRGERTRFWHDRDNRLPYDVVVVDEASMVSLTLMSRLVEALRPTCRLVLVGDPDQLSSVEVGAVLGDLVRRAAPPSAVPLDLAVLAPRDLTRARGRPAGGGEDRGVGAAEDRAPVLPRDPGAGRGGPLGATRARGVVLAAEHPGLELVDRPGRLRVRRLSCAPTWCAPAGRWSTGPGRRRRRRARGPRPAPRPVRAPARDPTAWTVGRAGRGVARRGDPRLRQRRVLVRRTAPDGHRQRLPAAAVQRRHRRGGGGAGPSAGLGGTTCARLPTRRVVDLLAPAGWQRSRPCMRCRCTAARAASSTG